MSVYFFTFGYQTNKAMKIKIKSYGLTSLSAICGLTLKVIKMKKVNFSHKIAIFYTVEHEGVFYDVGGDLFEVVKKIVYIAHPISGDVEKNLASLQKIYKDVTFQDTSVVPFIPYLATVYALDNNDPIQKAEGFSHNRALFLSGAIDELWVYGMSEGVQQEIDWATELNIPVVSKLYVR